MERLEYLSDSYLDMCGMMLQENLFEVGDIHVFKRLSGHSMVGKDGQVMLTRQFAQQVD